MSTGFTSHDFAFLKGFLARPWRVASPVPSGHRLACRVAEQVELHSAGVVLELGAGTGAVTRAIRACGVAEQDLVLVESEREFLGLLRKAFPRARVIEGDAFAFAGLLGNEAHGIRTIVSGLPVVGQPQERKNAFLTSAVEALAPGNPFVQLSYSAHPPFPEVKGVEVRLVATVRENFWPMRVWVYRRPGTKLRKVTE